MVKAVALFPTINSSTYLYVTNTTKPCRGLTSGCKGGQFPGRRITMGGAENFQQCHKYLLQYSKFASIRPQIQMCDRQICFFPLAPSNLVTPLVSCRSTPESRTALQERNEGGKRALFPGSRITMGAPKIPTISQVLSSIQYICFRKTSVSNMGTPKLLLAPGTI